MLINLSESSEEEIFGGNFSSLMQRAIRLHHYISRLWGHTQKPPQWTHTIDAGGRNWVGIKENSSFSSFVVAVVVAWKWENVFFSFNWIEFLKREWIEELWGRKTFVFTVTIVKRRGGGRQSINLLLLKVFNFLLTFPLSVAFFLANWFIFYFAICRWLWEWVSWEINLKLKMDFSLSRKIEWIERR